MAGVLAREGHDVVGLDTFYYDGCTLEDDGTDIPALRKDLRDVTREDLRGYDAVVHLAALCNDPLGDINPDWTYDINHHASVHLAEKAKQAGVGRFLYASSCSMYGAAAGDNLLTEEAPLRPLTPYAVSKVRTEEDVTKLADNSFSPVFMRNATVYGVSPRLRADVVLNNLTAWAYTIGKVRILSDGSPWRPIVHVEDVSYAFAAALAAPREAIHNQAINIGSNNQNYQVRDLAGIVEQVVPNCSVEYAGGAQPDPRDYRVDFAKVTRLLPAWAPRWDARRGAEQLYDAYRRTGLTTEDFQGRRYVRLKQLRYLLDDHELDGNLRWTHAQ